MEINLVERILGNESDVKGVPLTPEMRSFVDVLPIELIDVLNKIAQNGGGAWIVGGAVRDASMGFVPEDIDLATDLTPEQLLLIFPDAIETGVSFGTITIKSGVYLYQTTTLRTDGDYVDSRRPNMVEWSLSLFEDLRRRDFTINSMAIDVARETYYDPHNGIKDIKNKIIRCVGSPQKRIDEDALRILRAYRFLGQIDNQGWNIEQHLSDVIIENSYLLQKLSSERIWQEISKILMFDEPESILLRMLSDGILKIIFQWESFELSKLAVALNDLNGLDIFSRFVLLNHHLNLDEINNLCKSLKLSNKDRRNVFLTFKYALVVPSDSIPYLRLYRHIIGPRWRQVLLLSKIFCKHELHANFKDVTPENLDEIYSLLVELPQNKFDTQLIDGNWLMNTTKLKQGQKLGRLKEWLYRIQIENDLTQISEINLCLVKIQWQNGDFERWPKMSLE